MAKTAEQAYIYQAQIPGRDAPYLMVAYSASRARDAIAQRFNLPVEQIHCKSFRIDNVPALVYLHPAIIDPEGSADAGQCWADTNGIDRCENNARPGFHTCKIHTLFDAPAPFGTPEYQQWIAADPSETDSPAKSGKTRRKPRAPAAKAANRRSAARQRRGDAPA